MCPRLRRSCNLGFSQQEPSQERLSKEHPMQDRSPRWLSHLPFYYGWLIIAIGFVTMAIAVTARTAFSLLLPQGEPPALPGWLSEFDISGSMFFAVWARITRVGAAALSCAMAGCEKAPLRGPQP